MRRQTAIRWRQTTTRPDRADSSRSEEAFHAEEEQGLRSGVGHHLAQAPSAADPDIRAEGRKIPPESLSKAATMFLNSDRGKLSSGGSRVPDRQDKRSEPARGWQCKSLAESGSADARGIPRSEQARNR